MGFDLGSIFGGPVGIGLGLVSSVIGQADAASQQRRAKAALDAALADAQMRMDTSLERQRQQNAQNLYSAAGVGGDALRMEGSNLGSALANAGVYNSTGVAGALTQGSADLQTGLRGLASDQQQNLLSQQAQNQRYLAGLQVGGAQNALGQANTDLSNARQGFGGFLSNLGQFGMGGSQSPIGGISGGIGAGAGIGGGVGSLFPQAYSGSLPGNVTGGLQSGRASMGMGAQQAGGIAGFGRSVVTPQNGVNNFSPVKLPNLNYLGR